jgi:hypothetical protein
MPRKSPGRPRLRSDELVWKAIERYASYGKTEAIIEAVMAELRISYRTVRRRLSEHPSRLREMQHVLQKNGMRIFGTAPPLTSAGSSGNILSSKRR